MNALFYYDWTFGHPHVDRPADVYDLAFLAFLVAFVVLMTFVIGRKFH